MFPERIESVVVISGSPGLQAASDRESRRQEDEALAKRLEQQDLQAFLSQWYQQELFAGLRQWQGFEVLMQSKLRSHQAARLAQSLRQAGTGVAPSMWGRVPELHVPVLFISGQADSKFCQLGQQMQALWKVPQNLDAFLSYSGQRKPKNAKLWMELKHVPFPCSI